MYRIADFRLSHASSLRLCLGIATGGLFAGTAAAANKTWTGTTDQNWETGGNWGGTLPLTGDVPIIGVATGNFPLITSGSSFNPGDVLIGNGASSTGRLDLRAGSLTQNNVTAGAGNWFFVARSSATAAGTMNVADTSVTGLSNLTTYGQGTGSLTVGKLFVGGGYYAGGGTGVLNINTTGIVAANSTQSFNENAMTINASVVVGYGNGVAATGTLNLDGGTINSAGEMWIASRGATGTVHQAAGTTINVSRLTIGRSLTGTSVGTLNVSGTFNSNSSTVLNDSQNATTASQGTINVNNGGILKSENDLFVSWAGSAAAFGELNIATGATVNVATTTERALAMNTWDTAQGRINVNGGTLNLNANTDIRFSTGNGTGTSALTLNSGAVTGGANSYLNLNANADGAVDNTLHLNGGTLTIGAIISGKTNGSRVVNFNGGTLKPSASSTAFFAVNAASTANVRDGGAKIDTNGLDVTIEQGLTHSAIVTNNPVTGTPDAAIDGGLVKSGTGALTLSGASTYTGPTQVNAGTLDLDGSLTSDIAVGNLASLTGVGSTTGAITLNAGSSLVVDLSGAALGGNGINIAGPTSVVFTGGTLVGGNTYDVISTSGGTITGAANLIATSRGSFGSAPGKITFTAGGVGTRTWNTTDGNWVVDGPTNWLEGDMKFLNGDTVVFGSRPSPSTVTLVGNLFPADVSINNSTHPYTFAGSGSINGTATLTKNAAGMITIETANTYSGGTTLNAGTLNLNSATALGTGLLTINGGTLDNTSGSALVMTANNPQDWYGDFTFTGTNDLDMGRGQVTVLGDPVDRTVTVAASILGVGEISSFFNGLIKQGAGTLEVASTGTGAGGSVVSGGALEVAAGTLQINRTGVDAANSGDFTAAGLSGSGTVVNGAAVERWFFSNPDSGSFSFSGTLTNGNTGTLGFYKGGTGTQILSGTNSYTARTTVAGGELIISGTNSGPGSYTEIVSGKLTLANTQALGTAALIRFFGVDVSTLDLATDTDGTAYAITKATGTNIAIVSNRATPGAGINHTLTTDTLANGVGGGTLNFTSGANVTSGTGRITFTQFGLGAGSVQTTTLNPTTANVTLGNVAKQNNNVSQTLGLGGTSTDNHVTGVIANGPALTGANAISVLKSGTSTWTLSGANTYTGTTTVNEGTLSISQAVLADGASVSVATAGVLNLTHEATDTIDRFFIDGVEQVSGTWGSLTSSATNKTARITGTGILLATNGAATGGYGGWATALGLTDDATNDPDDNPDNDGFENGIEYILGGHPLNGSNNPKIHSQIVDTNADNLKELVMTIAVPQGTPAFTAGAPATIPTLFEGYGIAVRGSTNLTTFGETVTPVANPAGTPAPFVQGGITYEYRSFTLGTSNGLPGKGFLQVVVAIP